MRTLPSSPMNTVSAVMLRWSQPRACRCRSARRISRAISADRNGVSGVRVSRADSGRVATRSLTIHSVSSSINTSKTWAR